MWSTFSWQKVMGGEAAHGCSCWHRARSSGWRAFPPARPLPKISGLPPTGGSSRASSRARRSTRRRCSRSRTGSSTRWSGGVDRRARGAGRAGGSNRAVWDRFVARSRVDRPSRGRPGHAVQHLGLPVDRGRTAPPIADGAATFAKAVAEAARDGRGGARHRRVSRRAAGAADLVLDRRSRRPICEALHAVARPGLRDRAGGAQAAG